MWKSTHIVSGLKQNYSFIILFCVFFFCFDLRWWPAQICHPNFIPNNIQRMKHQPGEFPVEFLGSHDYHWIHRGRVFSYQEGDKGSVGTGGKYLGEIFKRGWLIIAV